MISFLVFLFKRIVVFFFHKLFLYVLHFSKKNRILIQTLITIFLVRKHLQEIDNKTKNLNENSIISFIFKSINWLSNNLVENCPKVLGQTQVQRVQEKGIGKHSQWKCHSLDVWAD